MITGEFSLAVTDCQKYLQGGYSTPYDPVTNNQTCQYYNGDFDNYEADHKDFLRSFFISQLDSYEAGERGKSRPSFCVGLTPGFGRYRLVHVDNEGGG